MVESVVVGSALGPSGFIEPTEGYRSNKTKHESDRPVIDNLSSGTDKLSTKAVHCLWPAMRGLSPYARATAFL